MIGGSIGSHTTYSSESAALETIVEGVQAPRSQAAPSLLGIEIGTTFAFRAPSEGSIRRLGRRRGPFETLLSTRHVVGIALVEALNDL